MLSLDCVLHMSCAMREQDLVLILISLSLLLVSPGVSTCEVQLLSEGSCCKPAPFLKISFTIGFVEDVVCPIPSGGNISVQLQYRIPPGSRQWTTFETYSPTVVTASEAVSLYICDSKLQDVELRWFQSSGLGADWYLDDLSVMQWNKSCYKELLFENFNDPNMNVFHDGGILDVVSGSRVLYFQCTTSESDVDTKFLKTAAIQHGDVTQCNHDNYQLLSGTCDALISNCSNFCSLGSLSCQCDENIVPLSELQKCLGGCNTANCEHSCTERRNGVVCSCNVGYILDADGMSCNDIDECGQTSTCSQLCKNSIGGYECGCLSGFTLSGDGQSCFKNSTPALVCKESVAADGYVWPETTANHTAMGTCFRGTSNATRKCNFNVKTSVAHWSEVDCHSELAKLYELISSDEAKALEILRNLTADGSVDLVVGTLFLGEILKYRLQRDNQSGNSFNTNFVVTASNLLGTNVSEPEQEAALASELLTYMDTFALQLFHVNDEEISTSNIDLAVVEVENDTDALRFQKVSGQIELPAEVFEVAKTNDTVIAASQYYYSVSNFLPRSLKNRTISSVLSPVISATVGCGPSECNKVSNLSNPVKVAFRHDGKEIVNLESSSTICAFLKLMETDEPSFPISGEWSTEGCTKLEESSSHMTICACNHLTHFAVLLSPKNVSEDDAFALQVIGYVGVSFSLVCLFITVIVLTFMRKLWSMRNYIHINLCISLFVAQLVFVIGIDKAQNKNVCTAIAVILHYCFLVAFMWLLMEGVVLYVTLIKVFIKNRKRYLLGYTIFSYGTPMVYLCITVPLGITLENGPHYGTETYCWLRTDTHFIWAFIAPVIVVLLMNFAFFVMAVTVMYKHHKRLKESTIKSATYWLKSIITLTVVMGFTWILGIFTFVGNQVIAYVFTIFVAFQGVIIFIVFVPMSRQFREHMKKLWTNKMARSRLLGDKSSTTGMTQVSNLNKSMQASVEEPTQQIPPSVRRYTVEFIPSDFMEDESQ